jgi:metal-dependent amidase/aminoacylase/carboxypeptidase family protein
MDAAFNHSAYFRVDEETFAPGVEMMTRLALDFPSRQSR